MFVLKQINKPFNQSCFRKIINGKRNLSLVRNTTENKKDTDYLDQHYLEYENKVLFNSIIESKRIKRGYRQNTKIMKEKKEYEERVATVLKTIRPFPLSFKYLNTPNSQHDQANKNICDKVVSEPPNEPSTKFPYHVNTHIGEIDNCSQKSNDVSIEDKILARKAILDKNIENWMTDYDNYEYDLVEENLSTVENNNEHNINYGTPNPNSKVSNVPCGGCGAYLHCKDTAIPGYIPSEIFENCFSPGGANLETILCQRCHFLKEYNIALQVRVSSDDYPKVLTNVPFNSAFVVLMVDLTDFPCSIWPGVADIVGHKTPIVVVGNKVDLLPKDNDKYLQRIKEVLYDNVKLCGFAGANIKHIELISAKTGYGIENLISSMHKLLKHKGDIYLIGCTNVGKSSLFNSLLRSDFCKIQAADLIQRATTSPWPGTTLNLLKFPVTSFSRHRLYLRHQRLDKLQAIEAQERKLQAETLKAHNSVKHATLIGRIERSFDKPIDHKSQDNFSMKGSSNLSGKTKMGINEKAPEYAFGRWCFDTPGVVHPDSILHLLTTEELVKTLPKQLIGPETFCIQPGTCLFIAGLARLDYVQGPNSIRLTVFRANDLPITVCQTKEADSLYKEMLGTELFAVPIDRGDRLTKWPGLELAKSFKLLGKSWKESSYDVVLSNAGWIAINCGLHEYEFQAWTPEKKGVYIRDCLLPQAVTLRGSRIRYSVAYKKHKYI